MQITHTVIANSHFPAKVWKEVIKDTLHGNAIDYTAQRIGCSHQTAYDIRHRVLMSLLELPQINGVRLGEVSEFDETFVPDCYKGRKSDSFIQRKPRKHGAKTEKRGISNEYVCICIGILRGVVTHMRLPSTGQPSVQGTYQHIQNHIADGTLALCDSLRSYHALPRIADCIVKDFNDGDKKASSIYKLNTVNGFHSFIKQRYVFYCGVASKYINRYNTLFAATYQNAESMIRRLTDTVLAVTSVDYHRIKDIKEIGLVTL